MVLPANKSHMWSGGTPRKLARSPGLDWTCWPTKTYFGKRTVKRGGKAAKALGELTLVRPSEGGQHATSYPALPITHVVEHARKGRSTLREVEPGDAERAAANVVAGLAEVRGCKAQGLGYRRKNCCRAHRQSEHDPRTPAQTGGTIIVSTLYVEAGITGHRPLTVWAAGAQRLGRSCTPGRTGCLVQRC